MSHRRSNAVMNECLMAIDFAANKVSAEFPQYPEFANKFKAHCIDESFEDISVLMDDFADGFDESVILENLSDETKINHNDKEALCKILHNVLSTYNEQIVQQKIEYTQKPCNCEFLSHEIEILKQQNAKLKSDIIHLKKEHLMKSNQLIDACNALNDQIVQKNRTIHKLQNNLHNTDSSVRDTQPTKKCYVAVWQWNEFAHDYGTNWKSYDHDMNAEIERLKINEDYYFLCAANQQNYRITKTSLNSGIQSNTHTGVVRKIRRQKIEKGGFNSVVYPKWWNMYGFSHNETYAKPKLFSLNLDSYPAKYVMNSFYKTVKNCTIVKIESVENQMLFDAYCSVRGKLSKLIGNNELNERELYHGTRSENVMNSVVKEGFRKEFNKVARFGNGTYFARDAKYSMRYSANNNAIYKMFQCKVICGESHIGKREFVLTNWPKKTSGLIYDSLVDLRNPSIFVIHDDAQAYPMFVIHFKRNRIES